MTHRPILILVSCLLLNGCAAVVVGGAVSGATALHDRRTAGSIVEDQSIEIQATDRLHEEGGPGRGNHIKVISYNQIVLLAGEVSEESDRERAEAIVSDIPKVRRVVNELALRPRTGAYTRSRDSLLTAQVKSSFLGMNEIEGFDSARVKVVSVRGIVYLMGMLTESEAQAAADRASRVRGVRKVVKVFEVVQRDG